MKLNYKEYLPFIASILMFLIILIYSAVLYIDWNKNITKKDYQVEVSLPIIDWQKYSNLSKQYSNVNLKKTT